MPENQIISAKTEKKLEGVHPALVAIYKDAAGTLPFRTTISEGVRSSARQAELYAKGRTTPGPQVTWVKTSRHQIGKDGFGHAIDVVPLDPDGSIPWNDLPKFQVLARAMLAAAKRAGIEIRPGSDWNGNGVLGEKGETDWPHFELPSASYP